MIALAQAYEAIAHAAGHVLAVPVAIAALALLWLVAGLDVTNLSISIISLLLLFILQSTQNRDGAAIQAKLDELIKSSAARNEFAGLDRLPASDIERLRDE